MATAVILGFLAHTTISRSEGSLATAQYDALTDQYDSIADRALIAALGINLRKRLGTISLSSILSYAHPNAEDWPFVTLPGFEEIAANLIKTSSGREMALCPLVTPEQRSSFEDFAYDFFENKHDPPFPNGTGVSSFGKGIWGLDFTLNNSDHRFHMTDANASYGSPNKLFTPILQHSDGAHPALMLNVRFEEVRGNTIDRIIECVQLRAKTGEMLECGAISPMIYLATQNVLDGPGALFFQPVFPANNLTTVSAMNFTNRSCLLSKSHVPLMFNKQWQMTAFVTSSIVWKEVLHDMFSSDVQGIDCVIETDQQVYTYTIVDGMAKFVGEGDLHERAYDSFRRTLSLTPAEYFSSLSANYTLSLYPSVAFYKVYSTNNATLVAAGAVGIILIVSALFCLYDSCVRRDITAKAQLLDAKRAFVRFVSHEVRTPLNSVCMGLMLMQEEIAKSVNCNSVDQLIVMAKNEEHPEATSGDSSSLSCFRLSQEIHTNVLRSVAVLNDLLNYDKIEMGNLTLELTVITLQELVEGTATEFAVAASQKKLDLTVDFEQVERDLKAAKDNPSYDGPGCSRDLRTVGDDVRLRQVMRNLLSNAIKFTPESGKIRVSASWVKGGPREQRTLGKFTLSNGVEVSAPRCGWLEVSVSDSGAGMTPDQVSKVFGVGVQFNSNELQGGNGTGLGLHIAKGIMEQHGGTLSVSSEGLGHGSTFTLKIPIHAVPPEKDNSAAFERVNRAASIDVASPTNFEASPLKILIVDDAAMNRKLLARLLRNHGHVCNEAEDGAVAVRLVKEAIDDSQPYDTVLLDNEMPVMDGPTAAEHMRDMGSDVFIVGITGNLLPEDVAIFKEKGANSVLPKPFKLSELESLWVEYDIYKGVDIS